MSKCDCNTTDGYTCLKHQQEAAEEMERLRAGFTQGEAARERFLAAERARHGVPEDG